MKRSTALLVPLLLAPIVGLTVVEVLTPVPAHGAATPEKPPVAQAEDLLKSDKYSDRIHALEILEGLDYSPRQENNLIKALADADWGVQIRAAEVLGNSAKKAGTDALVKQAMEGEIQWVRDAAVRALATLVPDEAGSLLLAQTKRTRDDAQKARALHGAAGLAPADELKKVAKLARDKDAYIAREASRTLAMMAQDPELLEPVLSALASVLKLRKDTRSFLPYSSAIEGLATVDSDEVRELLVAEVMQQTDDDMYVVERVARGLSAAEPTAAAAALHTGFTGKAKAPALRRLLRLAGRVGVVEAAEDVAGLVKHGDERVRSEAVRALGLMVARERADVVKERLTDDSLFVRVEAVTALARVLTAEDFMKLAPEINKEKAPTVRLQYVVELFDLNDPAGIAVLKPMTEDVNWRVSTAAAATIGAIGIAEDMPLLTPMLEHKDWRRRAAAYEGLGRLRAADAIPLLAQGLDDRDPVVKGVCWTNLQILTSEKIKPESGLWLAWYREHANVISIEKRSRRTAEEISAAERANERYGSITRDQGVEILQKARILVITGAWDKVQIVLEHLDIPHTLMRAQELKVSGLNPNQILLINCEGNLDGDTQGRVDWFVNVGGYLMTTDWALTKTVMPVFPGYVTQFARSSTGNDVVVVDESQPGHPYTAGVFGDVPALQWWLEIQAFPVTIMYPERVDVIVDSAEMRHRYGSSPMGFVFRSGLGRVQHSVSHFYLQEEGMNHASKPRDRMVFAADNLGLPLTLIRQMVDEGRFKGRLNEETMKEIAPEYSMFRLIVNFVREKSDWVENL